MTIGSGSIGMEGTAITAASAIPAVLIPTAAAFEALETLALGGLLLLSRP
ncbi:hypothetical protein KQX63_10330 [Rhodopseudomonas palustris]|jgi:hypothetical protein|nr:hypothetical protein [Rhodopseudomonas palustris]AVT76100.1 hypothetical protein RPPS3_20370 [Rhodopseudomonas palustris]AVT80912.1 hypothetical protein RPYSC3_20500 [Rhodopseudomonas palustris]UYO46373.1 hypothetical protein KQX63_10330 [Rhodopseudomonas palustris]UYO50953.1 hypothetical protein KQX64_10590 [Rhodopseudomonas palustris]UYO55860.1 hypothetical protein KQX61_10840 [Rhodopseudomonas palustris]